MFMTSKNAGKDVMNHNRPVNNDAVAAEIIVILISTGFIFYFKMGLRTNNLSLQLMLYHCIDRISVNFQ